MADLPMQRSARNQLTYQLLALTEGLQTPATSDVNSDRPLKVVQSRDGDTLHSIAFRVYGSNDYWLKLAEANRIEYPYQLVPGQILSVPAVE